MYSICSRWPGFHRQIAREEGGGIMAHERLWQLTPREQEIAALVAAGLTNPEISEWLSISIQTVSSHVSSILSKLEIDSREKVSGRLVRGQ